jgi:hypothetical protein
MSRSNLQQQPALNNPTPIIISKYLKALYTIGFQLPLQSAVLRHQTIRIRELVNLTPVKNCQT